MENFQINQKFLINKTIQVYQKRTPNEGKNQNQKFLSSKKKQGQNQTWATVPIYH